MARALGPVTRIDPHSRGHLRRRRRASRRRQRRAAGLRLLALTLFCGSLLGVATLLVSRDGDAASVRSPLTTAVADTSRDAAAGAALPLPAKRLRYRYSVIPRGAYSADELNAAIDTDPVVAAHYDTFDAARAALVPLDRARLAYVSYRLGDRVFWTRQPVRLAAGEAVLTDGRSVVRARCGNRISQVPGETSPDEPDPVLIDTPVADPDPLLPLEADPAERALLLPLLPPTVVDPGTVAGPALQTRYPDPDPPETIPPPPLVFPVVVVPKPRDVRSVPEPASVTLLAAGLFGLGVRMRRRLAHRQRDRKR